MVTQVLQSSSESELLFVSAPCAVSNESSSGLHLRLSVMLIFAFSSFVVSSSVYAVCSLLEISGTFQLFTSHHHLLIFAPTDCPFNVDDRFICLQPETTSVQAKPCTKGIMIYPIHVSPSLPYQTNQN
jgi:hypothetical protein